MEENDFTLTRVQASDFLEISLRSLDRYTQKKSITALRRGRDVFFNEQELSLFKENLENLKKSGRPSKYSTPSPDFAEVHHAQVVEQSLKPEEEQPEARQRNAPEENYPIGYRLEQGIYKKLFEDAEEELKNARQKLEMAHYRIGSLEGRIKTMVPLVEYKKQKDQNQALLLENKAKKKDVQKLQKQLQIEQFAKKIYAVFLFFMMALIPLLIILRLIS